MARRWVCLLEVRYVIIIGALGGDKTKPRGDYRRLKADPLSYCSNLERNSHPKMDLIRRTHCTVFPPEFSSPSI